MPAERQNRRKPRNAKAGPSSGPKFKVPALEARDGLPGVSKLKGQIRQTKRLLAKVSVVSQGWVRDANQTYSAHS